MTPLLVGPQHYRHLINALIYYEDSSFNPIDVPWAVSREAMNITRPAWAGPATLNYVAGGQELCPVASGEQSFLQLQLDARSRGENITGRWVTMTPCFRNEEVVDDLHQPYFQKVELIQWIDPEKTSRVRDDLDLMIQLASEFFRTYMNVAVIPNTDPDPIGSVAFDIVSLRSRIELGSYGIRNHESVGGWIYGTGLAEPRFSYVRALESKL